jgi:hypothetical protein
MATKSVIEIELIDEQFKAFSAQLKAMQSIVAGMPEQWKNITKEVQNEQKAESKAANEAEKARKKRLQEEKDFNKIIEDRKKSFMDAAYFTSNIAKNLASGALSIVKWTAFAAIGGGFGLGGLAASASDYRKRSQGLGTTTAGLRAAETNLSQYVDVNSVLGNITNLQHDITQQYKLTRLGGGKGDSAAQLQTVMTKAVQDFKAHGQDLNYAKAVGLTDIFSPEDLIRLAKLSAEELANTFKKMSQDLKRFEIDDRVNRKWQEFWQQLGRAGQNIQVILIDKLQTLVKPLTELSQTIINLISEFLNTHEVAKWIEGFGEKIKTFVNYLDSDDFKTSVTEFFEALKALGQAAINAAKFLGLIDRSKEEKATITKNASDLGILRGDIRKDINEPVSSWWKGVMNRPFIRDGRTIAERNNNPGNLKFTGQSGATLGENGFAKFNTVQDGFKALQNQLQLYGSGQSKAAGYKKLDTIEEIMKIYAPSNENDTEGYIKNLEKLTGHSRKESLDFSDTQTVSAMMAGISKVETGKNLYNPTQVQLLITNTTDTNVAVKGLTNK